MYKILIYLTLACLSQAQQSSATFTKVYNKVLVYESSKQPKAASLGKVITNNTSVQTGSKSKAELTYPDQVIARLGASTHFRFKNGSKYLELQKGVLFLRVPKGKGGAQVDSELVSTTVSGTSFLLEYHSDGWVKLITLEGLVSLKLKKTGQSVDIPAGRMAVVKANGELIRQPVAIDLKRLLATSQLLDTSLFSKLPKSTEILIKAVADKQEQDVLSGKYTRASKHKKPTSLRFTKRNNQANSPARQTN